MGEYEYLFFVLLKFTFAFNAPVSYSFKSTCYFKMSLLQLYIYITYN